MKALKRITKPLKLARVLVGHRRSAGNHLVLATILAATAGAANAGGFFALGQYTSQMTGYLSQFADTVAIGDFGLAILAGFAVSAFVAGAAFSAVVITWARSQNGRHQYAWPLLIQGGFLACFAGGGIFSSEAGRLFSLACLCFIMGMQNATITKISSARIRTTHATGMLTDIGIELGRTAYNFVRPNSALIVDNNKLRILLQLVCAFVGGGIIGAFGYNYAGFFFSLPLAGVLLTIGLAGFKRREHTKP